MEREHWGGRLAFVLAAAGSAVGLGNVWKFPYITGMNGGAAFILVYLACIALVGMPIMIAELAIGRSTQTSPIAAFRKLAPQSIWWLVGAMGVMAGYVILSFYSVVAGWTLEYMVRSVQGDYTGLRSEAAVLALKDEYVKAEVEKALKEAKAGGKGNDASARRLERQAAALELGGVERIQAEIEKGVEKHDLHRFAIGKAFGAYVSSQTWPVLWQLVVMAFTMLIVAGGVGGGLEKANKILMPVLLLILVALAIPGVTLPNSWAGVEFLVKPDFAKLTAKGVLEALGHAFFTLSLGMGAMLTYGSYLGKDNNLYKSGFLVVAADTGIALVAGLAIYPAVAAYGLDRAAGPGLVFISMPVVFTQMPAGYAVGAMFFGALFVAALTSAISLLEVCVAHMIDGWGWNRTRATLVAGVVITALGIPSAVGVEIEGLGKSFFDVMDFLSTNILLPVGGMMTAAFVGWAWSPERALGAVEEGDEGLTSTFGAPWIFLCRYVSPLLVLVVILYSLGILKVGG